MELAIKYGKDDSILCLTPLAGLSLYWPIAEEVARGRRKNERYRNSMQILVFKQPDRLPPGDGPPVPCDRDSGLVMTLKAAFYAQSDHRDDEARHCYSIAMGLKPASFVARYGAARSGGTAQSRIENLEAVVRMNPTFYEARVELAFALVGARQADRAVVSLNALLAARPPLPARCAATDALVDAFEQLDQSADVIRARRSYVACETELRGMDVSLVSAAILSIGAQDLAIAEEQAGEYEGAAKDFAESAKWSKDNAKGDDAYGFDAEMGQVRCLKATGANDHGSEWSGGRAI